MSARHPAQTDEDWDDYDNWDGPCAYEDSPLYADGYLAGMDEAGLRREVQRQIRTHDLAVDRCEEINSPTIEDAAARLRLCKAELKRRGLRKWESVE